MGRPCVGQAPAELWEHHWGDTMSGLRKLSRGSAGLAYVGLIFFFGAIVSCSGSSGSGGSDPKILPDGAELLSAPSDIEIVDERLNGFTIKWTPVEGATGYKVYINDEARECASTEGSSAEKYICRIDGLEGGKNYVVKVATLNADSIAGKQSIPDERSRITLEPPVVEKPVPPARIDLIETAQNSFTIEFDRAPGATGYNVYVDEKLATCSESPAAEEGRYRCVVSGLEAGKTYEKVEVSTRKDGLESERVSYDGSISTDAPPEGVPAAPTAAQAVRSSSAPRSALVFSWDLESALGYVIYMGVGGLSNAEKAFEDDPAEPGQSTSGIGKFAELTFECASPTNRRQCVISGVRPGELYSLQVAARNDAGEGFRSEALSIATEPAAIVDLTAALDDADRSKAFLISWERVDLVENYDIYLKADQLDRILAFRDFPENTENVESTGLDGSTRFLCSNLEPNRRQCRLSALEKGTKYTIEVKARRNDLEGAAASESITTALDRPTDAEVVSVGSTSIVLEWNIVERADGYRVYLDGTPKECAKVESGYDGDVKYRCQIDGLTSGLSHEFEVVSLLGSGDDAIESSRATISGAQTALAPPSVIEIIYEGTSALIIEWSRISGADGYRVYRDGEGTDCVELTEGVQPGKYRCEITNLQSDRAFQITVATLKDSLEGDASAPLAIHTAPATLNNFTISRDTTDPATVLNLSWSAIEGANYIIYIGEAKAYEYDRAQPGNSVKEPTFDHLSFECSDGAMPDSLRCEVGGLLGGESYTFALAALKSDREGDKVSKEITTALAPPSDAQISTETSAIILEWTRVAKATGYKVYRNPAVGDCAEVENGSDSSAYRCRIENVASGSTVEIEISSLLGDIEGARSSKISATTKLPAPSNARVAEVGVSTITLEWDALAGATGYKVYLDDVARACSELTGAPTGKYRCRVSGLDSNRSYSIEITTLNAGGESARSEVLSSAKTLLDAPSNVALIETETTRLSITLEWDTNEGASAYRVYLTNVTAGGESETDCSESTGSDAGRYRCRLDGLNPNTKYRVAVSSLNDAAAAGPRSTPPVEATTLARLKILSSRLYFRNGAALLEGIVDAPSGARVSVKVDYLASAGEAAVDDNGRWFFSLDQADLEGSEREEFTVEASYAGLSGPVTARAENLPIYSFPQLRAHTPLSVGEASYRVAFPFVTTSPEPLAEDFLIGYVGVDPVVTLKRDENHNGDFDEDNDTPITDTAKFELDTAAKRIVLKSGLEVGLYRLTYTIADKTSEYYIDIAPTLYVDTEEAGSGDCSSWENACNDANAIATIFCPPDYELKIIKMKIGIYKPAIATSFKLCSYIRVYGGYGSADPDPDTGRARFFSIEPHVSLNRLDHTIFSCDQNGDDYDADGNVTDMRSDNCENVFANTNGLLNGVIIESGNATSPPYDNEIAEYYRVWSGGGMLNYANTPTLSEVIFFNNRASDGGAMANWHESGPTMISVVFYYNKALRNGGAISSDQSYVSIVSSVFNTNSAESDGGAIFIDSGGMIARETLFLRNKALGNAGAVYVEDRGSFTSVNTIFGANSAGGNGGALTASDESILTFINGLFYADSSDSDGDESGAGMSVHNDSTSELRALNTLFWDSSSQLVNGTRRSVANTDGGIQNSGTALIKYSAALTDEDLSNDEIFGESDNLLFTLSDRESIFAAYAGAPVRFFSALSGLRPAYSSPLIDRGAFVKLQPPPYDPRGHYRYYDAYHSSDGTNWTKLGEDGYSSEDLSLAKDFQASDFLGRSRIDQPDIGAYESDQRSAAP